MCHPNSIQHPVAAVILPFSHLVWHIEDTKAPPPPTAQVKIREAARHVKIKRQIVLVKSAFSKLYNILRNLILSVKTKIYILNCYVNVWK